MEENLQYQNVKDEFAKYYKDRIKPQLEIWEKKRRKYFSIFCIMCLITLLWICALLINFNGSFIDTLNKWGLILCLLILIASCPLFLYYQRSKESILPLLINFFGNFSYSSSKKKSIFSDDQTQKAGETNFFCNIF